MALVKHDSSALVAHFGPFIRNDDTDAINAFTLPIDTHSLVAMIAPRGLLILDNPHLIQTAAFSGHAGALGGAEVFEALGARENISYHSDVSGTEPCSDDQEYNVLLAYKIRKFLKREDADTGSFSVGADAGVDFSEWRDWTTPTLEDDAAAN